MGLFGFGKSNNDKSQDLFDKGFSLCELGKDEESVACYDEAIRLNPEYADAWSNKGFALNKLERYEESIICYNQAIRFNSNDPNTWNNRGNSLGDLKKFEEAIACYDESIRLNPEYSSPWNNKGLVLSELEKYEEAIACYDEAIRLNPEDADAWDNKQELSNRLPRNTIDSFNTDESVNETFNGNTKLILNDVKSSSQGKPEEAIQCHDKALVMNPDDKDEWNAKGDALDELGNHEEAILCYDHALRINPDDSTWAMKGIVLNKINRHHEASICFDKALAINPQNNSALAMKKSNQMLVDSDDPITFMEKGLKLFKIQKYDEAIPYFKNTIKSLEQFNNQNSAAAAEAGTKGLIINTMELLAGCLLYTKKYEELITYLDKALLTNPNNDNFLYKKSRALHELGKHDEGLVCISKALIIKPENNMLWNTKGNLFFQLLKYEEAIICFDKALEIEPDNPIHLSNKGECLDKLLKYAESISYYEKALEKDPNNEKIQKDSDAVKVKLLKYTSLKNNEDIEEIQKNEPLDILKMRLAKGEITLDEFNKIKKHLE